MRNRLIVWLMIVEAATLVVGAAIHLPNRAGVAESVIAVVLLGGALALRRGFRRLAIAAVVFAIAGFGVGLSETVPDGQAGAIAYHVTMLPILLLTLQQLVRSRLRIAGDANA